MVCKPLKVHGIHTVSIHPGASSEHQIQGYVNADDRLNVLILSMKII